MHGDLSSLPSVSSWRGASAQVKLYLYFIFIILPQIKPAKGLLYCYFQGYKIQYLLVHSVIVSIGGCIQKFPDWPPAAKTANDTALCQ